jgi:hypothetical protein
MTYDALLILLVAGSVGVLVAIGRTISAANFGRQLRAARASIPTRSPARHGSAYAGGLVRRRDAGDTIRH